MEFALDTTQACRNVSYLITLKPCDYVEAFIDTITMEPPWPPVFYRCYWYSPNTSTSFETVDFEWSVTSEYIEWYVKTIAIPNHPNSVQNRLGGTAPQVTGF